MKNKPAKHSPSQLTETTSFGERVEAEFDRKQIAWALEQERQRQEAGLPAPPLFPKQEPPATRREIVFDEQGEYARQKNEFAARAAELRQQGVTVLSKKS